MAAHIQIDGYADFKATADALTGGTVFYTGTPGNGNNLDVWYILADYIVTNRLEANTGGTTVTDPGTFATDFPSAVALANGFITSAD